MTHKPKRHNSLNWGKFVEQTQKRFKKRHGKHISSADIKKIWDDYVEKKIIAGVLAGNKVQIDKFSTIQLIGKPVEDDPKFYAMLRKGQMVRRDGAIVRAKIGQLRKDVKYKIIYTNTLGKEKIYFKADPKFARRVRESLNNTNTYYKVNYVNK